jgi:hypothetical protein
MARAAWRMCPAAVRLLVAAYRQKLPLDLA